MNLPTQAKPGSVATLSPRLITRPFLVAVVVLAVTGGLAGPAASWLGIKQGKKTLPLKAALTTLDERALTPYRVINRHVLPPEIVDALGTKEYIYWQLVDTSVANGDPLQRATLFVTYYTGGSNLVPHTPDACFTGTGYELAQPHENITVTLPSLDRNGEAGAIPVRLCTFMKTAVFDHEKVTVLYTFGCNGRFACTRHRVRVLVHAPTNTYAYFSKVEVSFPGATRAQSVEGARKLLNVVLPVLMDKHWPDFEAAERAVDNGDTTT